MFGSVRRFPFRGLALVAIGFLLASMLAGGGSAASGAATGLGFALLIPLLFFKMMFMVFLFGALFRFAGGGGRRFGPGPGWGRGGPWSGHHHYDRHRDHGDRRPYQWERDDQEFDRERRDWEESRRRAEEELRKYDTPYPRYPEGFEPPKPSADPEGFEPPKPAEDFEPPKPAEDPEG